MGGYSLPVMGTALPLPIRQGSNNTHRAEAVLHQTCPLITQTWLGKDGNQIALWQKNPRAEINSKPWDKDRMIF